MIPLRHNITGTAHTKVAGCARFIVKTHAEIPAGKGINMPSAMLKNATVELLERLHKNLSMGADSILALLPKIGQESTDFKSDLSVLLDSYERFTKRINALLQESGEKTASDSLWNRMTAKVGVAMATLSNTSPSHLAGMVIEGSTMNRNESIKLLREFENTAASEAALALVRDIIGFEERNIEHLKGYL